MPKASVKLALLFCLFLTPAFAADTTPPAAPVITSVPVYSQGTSLTASWQAASDPQSGIAQYSYMVAASADGKGAVVKWTPLTASKTSVTVRFPSPLKNNTKYYFLLKARNKAGLWSKTAASGAILIDRTPPALEITSPTPGQVFKE